MPDVQELPRATIPMGREEVSALGSARREEIRRQIELSDRLKANPLLYLVSPQVKVRFRSYGFSIYCLKLPCYMFVCWLDLNNKQYFSYLCRILCVSACDKKTTTTTTTRMSEFFNIPSLFQHKYYDLVPNSILLLHLQNTNFL